MSATNDAGKILLTPKGEYNGSTTYEVMDAVYYITSTVKGVYVAKGATTGNLPTDTTKWKLLIDLSDFITDATLATSSTVGLVKPDGITDEVDALGVLTALGVVIKAEINTSATEYSATWLKVGTTTLTPSTKQMYRVTESGVECLYYWNGTAYTKIPTGHTIVNSSNTVMATRSKLKFTGATVTDDSANDQTVVQISGGGSSGVSISTSDLIKDTVGFTGKNRAYSQTNNAVIADIESGKSYKVSWTGSATITLKKDSASGTEITSGSTSPLSFTADADYSLYFGSSADVTNIMVCDADITDSTFEEYHESVDYIISDPSNQQSIQNQINDICENGAVNHAVYPYYDSASVIRGVTWADNNGVLTSSGEVASGSSDSDFFMSRRGTLGPTKLKKGTYRITGCPKGGSPTTYLISCSYLNASNQVVALGADYGDGAIITIDDNAEDRYIQFYCEILPAAGNQTLTWKPMIAPASYTGGYVPFAMTNRELTKYENITLTSAVDGVLCRKVGSVITCNINSTVADVVANTWKSVGIISNTALRPTRSSMFFACVNTGGDKAIEGQIGTDGSIQIRTTMSGTIGVRGNCTYII